MPSSPRTGDEASGKWSRHWSILASEVRMSALGCKARQYSPGIRGRSIWCKLPGPMGCAGVPGLRPRLRALSS
eukprot:scaffold699_cov231-Pinguiococcus_pyrenoidosus.AAC.21